MNAFLGSIHRLLARSSFAATAAAKIRNQANCVIAFHLGETADPTRNGEYRLVDQLKPQIRTFVDVGANVGNWSAHVLSGTAAFGYLFEASSACAARLRTRFPDSAVVVRHVAVADQIGTAEFFEEDEFGEGSSLSDTGQLGSGVLKQVDLTTLDAEFQDPKKAIDFLKIDTEGHDLRVLKGANALLRRTRFVQFEYNSYWITTGSTLLEASRYLDSLGFSVFLIRSSGLHPFRYAVWNDYYRYSNFFACRTAEIEDVRPLLRDPL